MSSRSLPAPRTRFPQERPSWSWTRALALLVTLCLIVPTTHPVQAGTLPPAVSRPGIAESRGDSGRERTSPGIVWSWGDNFHGHLGNGTPVDSEAPTRVSGVMSATAVTSGPNHGLAIQSDGTLLSWGDNFYGQLGIGSTVSPISRPVTVAGRFGLPRLDGVVDIAAGLKHSVALLDDGTVWSFGDNAEAQLGTANVIDSPVPTQTLVAFPNGPLTNIRSVAAGERHSLALGADGIPYGWGQNSGGQLGQGIVLGDFNRGVQIGLYLAPTPPLSNVVAIAAGGSHSLFLLADGTFRATGRNNYGQVGIGSTATVTASIAVKGIGGTGILSTVIAIAAGRDHSLALLVDGRVVAWGIHNSGELGIGVAPESCDLAVPCSTVPRLVVGEFGSGTLSGVRAIAAGTYFSLALKEETVLSWGFQSDGQLGNATPTSELCGAALTNPCRRTPRRALFLDGIGAIAAGGESGFAIQTFGAVRAWGDNSSGQLGLGHREIVTGSVAVPGPGGVRAVATGEFTTFGLTEFGISYALGANSKAQLGTGTLSPRVLTPTQVARSEDGLSLLDIDSVAAGEQHGLAVLRNGTVRAWGTGTYGKLGNGSAALDSCDTLTCSLTARPVVGLSGSGSLTNVVAVAAGLRHSLALLGDGTARSWGSNDFGQLGVNGIGATSVPTVVRGIGGSGVLTNIIAIAASRRYNLALGVDGRVRSWGLNENGVLGNDSLTSSTFPTLVIGLAGSPLDNVVAIAAGGEHALALRADGSVWAWGSNIRGQLGADVLPGGCGSTCAARAVQVLAVGGSCCLGSVVAIAAGGGHSLALLETGEVVAWGNNGHLQLGFAPTGETCLGLACARHPTIVPNVSHATAIAASEVNSLAIVPRRADLSVALALSPAIPVSGGLLTADLVVSNLGPDTAAGPSASGVYPTGFGFGSGGPFLTLAISSGLTRTVPGSLIPQCLSNSSILNRTVFECLASGIDAGRTFTMTLELTVTAASGALVQALGTATEFDDPVAANNSSLAKATVNTPPGANAGQASTSAAAPVVITLSATDPDSGQTITYQIVQAPANGTLGPVTGNQVTYTPAPGFSGSDTFTFRANDGLENGPTATVQITVVAAPAGSTIYLPVVNVTTS